MLVVQHDQQCFREQLRIGAQAVVDAGNQRIATHDVVRRMLVVLVGPEIGRLDKGEGRQVAFGHVLIEMLVAPVFAEMVELVRHYHGLRHVAEIDAPVDMVVGQLVIQRALVVEMQRRIEEPAGLADLAERGAALGEQPVDPGRARHRGEPVVADHELFGQQVKRGQEAAWIPGHHFGALVLRAGRVGRDEVRHEPLAGAAGELCDRVGQIVARVPVDVAGRGFRAGPPDRCHPGWCADGQGRRPSGRAGSRPCSRACGRSSCSPSSAPQRGRWGASPWSCCLAW